MAAMVEKQARVFLEKGCEFTLKHRVETVSRSIWQRGRTAHHRVFGRGGCHRLL